MAVRREASDYYFNPGGELWKYDRENALIVFGGQRALLMQIAHPLIAQSVYDAGGLEANPFGRLFGTVDKTYKVIFGTKEENEKAAAAVSSMHDHVHGELQEGVGKFLKGTRYSARNWDQQQVVWSTLVDTAVMVTDGFIKPMTDKEKEAYYQDAKGLLLPFGGRPDRAPATYADFTNYMGDLVQNELAVGSVAKELAPHILLETSPLRLRRFPSVEQGLITATTPLARTVSAPTRKVAIGLLDEPLRQQFGYPVTERDERFLARVARTSQEVLPHLPDTARYHPYYLRARRSLRHAVAI